MTTWGFCYVADCEAFVDEALVSIASLRKCMPDAPIALVTDRKLFRQGTPVTDWVEMQQPRRGPIVKSEAWRAPYDRVCFLDTDMLIIDDLSPVFELLDKYDFASTAEPNARPDRGVDAGVPLAFPELNNAFFAFRKTPAVEAFFAAWIAEFDLLNERSGVSANQPAFRIALWKSESIRHLTLGWEYNLIPHTNPSVSGRVAIIHDRSPDRDRLARIVNRHVGPRAIVSGFGPVFGFITRRGWSRQFARLTRDFVRTLLRPATVQQQGHPVKWWQDEID